MKLLIGLGLIFGLPILGAYLHEAFERHQQTPRD